MLRLRDLLRVDLVESGKQSNNLKAVATLGVLLGTVTLLTLACILLPLWMRRGDVRGASSLLLFFIAIGLGFMLVETSQMQRLIIARGALDAVAVGPERRRVGARLRAERVHRPDVVDLRRVLDGMGGLRACGTGLPPRLRFDVVYSSRFTVHSSRVMSCERQTVDCKLWTVNFNETGINHRHHRPGRVLPRRAAPREGLRSARRRATGQHHQLLAHRAPARSHHAAPGRSPRSAV